MHDVMSLFACLKLIVFFLVCLWVPDVDTWHRISLATYTNNAFYDVTNSDVHYLLFLRVNCSLYNAVAYDTKSAELFK
jgi:hypothetical protein